MSVALWFGVVVAAVSLAYNARFSGATLSFGRALSDTSSGTGYQDAVTPPWQTKFVLIVYGLVLAVLALSWYGFGVGRAIATLLVLILGSFVAYFLVPKQDSNHFRRLIIVSMSRRYADYVRDGDSVRADAMKMLLRKAGIDPDVIAGA